jgi:hypothetical protein
MSSVSRTTAPTKVLTEETPEPIAVPRAEIVVLNNCPVVGSAIGNKSVTNTEGFEVN